MSFEAPKSATRFNPLHVGVSDLSATCGRFADNGEFLNYGAAEHLRLLKGLKIGSRDEIGYMIRSLNNIR